MRKASLLLLITALLLSACGRTEVLLDATPGVVVPGDSFVVTGADFGAVPGVVSLDGVEVAAGNVDWQPQAITVTVPPRAPSGAVSVMLASGVTFEGSNVQVIDQLDAIPVQSATIEPGVTLAEPFHVRLFDTSGRPVAGEVVTFRAANGAVLHPESVETDASGYASSYLTLPSEPGRFVLTARVRCGTPHPTCYRTATISYDTTEPKHYVLGAPLLLSDGRQALPGWLRVQGEGGAATARVYTTNFRPDGLNSLHPAGAVPAAGPLAPAAIGAALLPRSASTVRGSAPAHVPEADLQPTEILVTYRAPMGGGFGQGAMSALGAASASTESGQAGSFTSLIELPAGTDVEALAELLGSHPNVLVAEPNYRIMLAPLPNDSALHEQWGTFAVGAPVAWHTATGAGSDVVVAVVDSGIDLGHPELSGRLLPGYDFCSDTAPNCRDRDDDPSSYHHDNWHGTHVAGIVAASADDGVGVVGVAPGIRVLPVKVFHDAAGGTTTVAALIDAIRWAAGLPVAGVPMNQNPANVINLSLGGRFKSTHLQVALDEVRRLGVVVVAAAGNTAQPGAGQPVEFPAAARGVIAVGSVGKQLTRSGFSNHGVGEYGPGGIDIVAPGERILSTIPHGWGNLNGTSMATPHVAAAAALLLVQDPSRSPDEIERLLNRSAYYDSRYMSRSEYGAGLLRVDGALGLPAPTDRRDRWVTVTIDAPGSGARTVRGTLDLLTGESDTLDLGRLPTAGQLDVALAWGHANYTGTAWNAGRYAQAAAPH